MLDISNINISNLKLLGEGSYGFVYKLDNKYAIKIYKDKIKTFDGEYINNPSLKMTKYKLLKIKKYAEGVEKTDFIEDLIIKDNKVIGVKMKYYKGLELSNIRHLSFEQKIKLARQIIINTYELNKHNIYPTDLKPDNIMLVDKEIKFIDLDDRYTHYTKFLKNNYLKKSIESLDYSLKVFFDDYSNFMFYNDIIKECDVSNFKKNTTYTDINKYLQDKKKLTNIVYINALETINEEVIKYIKNSNSKVILVANFIDDEKLLARQISILNRFNISVYNIILSKDLHDNKYNFNTKEVVEIKNKRLLKR